jgi:hypothetical protein
LPLCPVRAPLASITAAQPSWRRTPRSSLAAKSGPSATLPEKLKSRRLKLPTVSVAPRSVRPISGRFDWYLIAPPLELRPYSVPCGPRRNSMRSKSRMSSSAPIWRPM